MQGIRMYKTLTSAFVILDEKWKIAFSGKDNHALKYDRTICP